MNLTSQIADHILRCFFNALLHSTRCNLHNGDIRFDGLTVIDEQQRAKRDINFLRAPLAGWLNCEREIHLCLLGLNSMRSSVRTNPRFATEFNIAGNFGSHNTTFRGGHTTGVERPHRELGSWLTNGLGSDDANGFA